PGGYRILGRYRGEARTWTTIDFGIALVDFRSNEPEEREVPTPDVVEVIANTLQLRGGGREQRWYTSAE
ncbi:hypothetical protein K523DRAFT_190505, partial [Schizophyllum commune Tattone D]